MILEPTSDRSGPRLAFQRSRSLRWQAVQLSSLINSAPRSGSETGGEPWNVAVTGAADPACEAEAYTSPQARAARARRDLNGLERADSGRLRFGILRGCWECGLIKNFVNHPTGGGVCERLFAGVVMVGKPGVIHSEEMEQVAW